MGKRKKRARTLLKKMSISGETISLETARRFGIEKEVQAAHDQAEAKRIAEEQALAEANKQKEAENAKRLADAAKVELEAKTKAKAPSKVKTKTVKPTMSKTIKDETKTAKPKRTRRRTTKAKDK